MKYATPDIAPEKETSFVTMDDLINRHVVIIPRSIEWKDGDNGKYESITAAIVVLDGRKTDKMPSLPHVDPQKYISGVKLVPELRRFVGLNQPVLGVVGLAGKAKTFTEADSDVRAAFLEGQWDEVVEPLLDGPVPTPDRLANPKGPQKQDPPDPWAKTPQAKEPPF